MYRYFKSIFDLTFAAFFLVLLLPLMFIIFLFQLVWFKNPVFVQERPGRNGEIFKLIKFRSLKIDGDESTMTSFGRFLRLTSLDELPQLINILKGEMSLIGPRPLLVEYLDRYNDEQYKRHLVKPGITGLAQVSGRNKLSWHESLALDTYYAENYSIILDLKILVKTVAQLFKFSETEAQKGNSRGKFPGNK